MVVTTAVLKCRLLDILKLCRFICHYIQQLGVWWIWLLVHIIPVIHFFSQVWRYEIIIVFHLSLQLLFVGLYAVLHSDTVKFLEDPSLHFTHHVVPCPSSHSPSSTGTSSTPTSLPSPASLLLLTPTMCYPSWPLVLPFLLIEFSWSNMTHGFVSCIIKQNAAFLNCLVNFKT